MSSGASGTPDFTNAHIIVDGQARSDISSNIYGVKKIVIDIPGAEPLLIESLVPDSLSLVDGKVICSEEYIVGIGKDFIDELFKPEAEINLDIVRRGLVANSQSNGQEFDLSSHARTRIYAEAITLQKSAVDVNMSATGIQAGGIVASPNARIFTDGRKETSGEVTNVHEASKIIVQIPGLEPLVIQSAQGSVSLIDGTVSCTDRCIIGVGSKYAAQFELPAAELVDREILRQGNVTSFGAGEEFPLLSDQRTAMYAYACESPASVQAIPVSTSGTAAPPNATIITDGRKETDDTRTNVFGASSISIERPGLPPLVIFSFVPGSLSLVNGVITGEQMFISVGEEAMAELFKPPGETSDRTIMERGFVATNLTGEFDLFANNRTEYYTGARDFLACGVNQDGQPLQPGEVIDNGRPFIRTPDLTTDGVGSFDKYTRFHLTGASQITERNRGGDILYARADGGNNAMTVEGGTITGGTVRLLQKRTGRDMLIGEEAVNLQDHQETRGFSIAR